MSVIINRSIKNNLIENLFQGKIVILYGPRRVGKTTLVKQILKEYPQNSAYFNCEEPDINQALTSKTSTELKTFFGDLKLVVLDEAQKVLNIGTSLKLLVDNFLDLQIIATGSSSLDLANRTKEPLTGRKIEFFLPPISIGELNSTYSKIELQRLIPNFLRFGLYPELLDIGENQKIEKLRELSSSYLFRDVFDFQTIKNPEVLTKLLQLLALQIGSEVSYHELATKLGIDVATVERYIWLLEQAFVVYRLVSFSRNIRNEISKKRKIYFYDLGIRNSLIGAFNQIDIRNDAGGLWENFCVNERKKVNSFQRKFLNEYFWRIVQGQEIDYIEESNGQLKTFEFKWNSKKKTEPPKLFLETYAEYNPTFEVITPENWLGFVG